MSPRIVSARPARRTKSLVMGSAAVLALLLTGLTAPAGAAGAATVGDVVASGVADKAKEQRAKKRAAAQVKACAKPALAPSVRLVPEKQAKGHNEVEARKVAGAGAVLKLPARAQALAIVAVLEGDLKSGKPTKKFYAALRKVKGWETLPPSIAVHRVFGNPDPFRYEAKWNDAVALLGKLSPAQNRTVESLVSVGGKAPSRCYASAADTSALPLPPGTSFTVRTRKAVVALGSGPDVPDAEAKPAAQASAKPLAQTPTPNGRETLFEASCGTPIVAATAGEVTVVQDNAAAGPWLITVRGSGGIEASYAHVQSPNVGTGDTVLVGQPIAEVGDFGQVDACALGLTITSAKGKKVTVLDAVEFLTRRGAAVEDPPSVIPATSFRVGTYNVLGYHLTQPGGSRPGWGNGVARVQRGLARLEANNVDIVVLNEFETPQASVFLNDPDWSLHRATPNNVFRDGNTNGNAVAWRSASWKLLNTTEFTVPYKTTLKMPVVTLQHQKTGAIVRVIAVHNPSGSAQGSRNTAKALELGAVSELRRRNPDVPVIIAGDMNERNTLFCSFTGPGYLQSSAGGSVGGACSVPRHGPVDWIFGTLDLNFAAQYIDKAPLSQRITDHPMVLADVVFPEHQAPDLDGPDVGDPNLAN